MGTWSYSVPLFQNPQKMIFFSFFDLFSIFFDLNCTIVITMHSIFVFFCHRQIRYMQSQKWCFFIVFSDNIFFEKIKNCLKTFLQKTPQSRETPHRAPRAETIHMNNSKARRRHALLTWTMQPRPPRIASTTSYSVPLFQNPEKMASGRECFEFLIFFWIFLVPILL